LTLRPEDGRVRSRLATVLTVMGRVDEGLALLDESLTRTPDNYYVLRSKADVLRIAQRLPDSRATLLRAIDAWPQRADAWIQLGALEVEAGRPGDALRAFEQGYSLEPTNPKAIVQLAQHMTREGRPADAASLLEDSLPRVDAPSREVLVYMLQIQERTGRSKAVLDATRERIRRVGGAPTTPSRR